MDDTAGEVIRVQRTFPALDLDIAKTEKSEEWPDFSFLSVGHIAEARLGLAQIVAVEIAVLQDFTELEDQLAAPGCPGFKAELANHVLAQIED